jgi:hypothetical protein
VGEVVGHARARGWRGSVVLRFRRRAGPITGLPDEVFQACPTAMVEGLGGTRWFVPERASVANVGIVRRHPSVGNREAIEHDARVRRCSTWMWSSLGLVLPDEGDEDVGRVALTEARQVDREIAIPMSLDPLRLLAWRERHPEPTVEVNYLLRDEVDPNWVCRGGACGHDDRAYRRRSRCPRVLGIEAATPTVSRPHGRVRRVPTRYFSRCF